MPVHLVGETIDKARSHYLAQTGRLVQLMPGIYVDATEDIDQTVLSHAVRISRYLYPKAYLSAIRSGTDDHRLLAMEDLCSVLDLAPQAKYSGTIERVARVLRSQSTAPDEGLLILVKRVVFAWLIADGDMHLKNTAVLKTAEPGEATLCSVRCAPVYDTLTTRVFPRLEQTGWR